MREGEREGRRDGERKLSVSFQRTFAHKLFVFPISSAYVLNLINHINNYIYYNYPICECRC